MRRPSRETVDGQHGNSPQKGVNQDRRHECSENEVLGWAETSRDLLLGRRRRVARYQVHDEVILVGVNEIEAS